METKKEIHQVCCGGLDQIEAKRIISIRVKRPNSTSAKMRPILLGDGSAVYLALNEQSATHSICKH